MIPKSLLIFLHGSGGSGRDIRSFLEGVPIERFGYNSFTTTLSERNIHHVDLLTPTADLVPYTPMGGGKANVWFDRSNDFIVKGLNDLEDTTGADRSLHKINTIIAEKERNYDYIFIGGHSMGGGQSLHFLRSVLSSKVVGIFSIGSFLVNNSQVYHSLNLNSARIPLLMMHGESDDLIRCEWGKTTATNLLLKQVNLQFRTYPGYDHFPGDNQMVDLVNWMEDIIIQNQKLKLNEVCDSKMENIIDNLSKNGNKDEKYDHKYDEKEMENENIDSDVKPYKSIDDMTEKLIGTSITNQDHTKASNNDNSNCLPYTIEYVKSSTTLTSSIPRVTIRYPIPPECISLVTQRPVLACGALFEILPDKDGVKTTLQSNDPHKTAEEIGKRLHY
eukprot:gene8998-12138_t